MEWNKIWKKNYRILAEMKPHIRILLAAVILLWIGAGIQAIINAVTWREENIADAFAQTNAGLMQSSLTLLAEYEEGFGDDAERMQAMHEFADGIGLVIDDRIEKRESSDRVELSYSKHGKYAETILKSIALNRQSEEDGQEISAADDYILLRLVIYQDTDRILQYRELAEQLCDKAGYKIAQVRMSWSGSYDGNLSVEERDRVTGQLLAGLSGNIAYASRKESDYTIYAYTEGIRDYVISAGKKINIQIIMEYDPAKDQTKVTVASPVAG